MKFWVEFSAYLTRKQWSFSYKKMNHLLIVQKCRKLKWWKICCIFFFLEISVQTFQKLEILTPSTPFWIIKMVISVLNGLFSMHQNRHFKGLWRLRTAYCLHSLNDHFSRAVLIHAQSCACPFHSQKLIKTLTLIHLFQQQVYLVTLWNSDSIYKLKSLFLQEEKQFWISKQ